jgi:hypothetical protein
VWVSAVPSFSLWFDNWLTCQNILHI